MTNPTHTGGIGSAPIEAEYREQMNALAKMIDEYLNGTQRPRKNGFVLMMFGFDHTSSRRCNYISNANREDVKIMLREQLSYFEGMPESTDDHRG